MTTQTTERTYLTGDGRRIGREAYVVYLRECAQRWRNQPAQHVNPERAKFERRLCEEQAARVEERAARIERGEED